MDPGDVSQGPTTPATVDFPNQASVLLNAASAARVAGGTVMDRPEWITVAPDNSAIYCTLTNNSGREVTDAANPRLENRSEERRGGKEYISTFRVGWSPYQ